MQYTKLGSSNLDISRVCLGTMTWGTQNNQQDANEQIAYALDEGINFFDTAEMYSIPPTPESYGATETIIGNWFHENQRRREDVILATKTCGGLEWIRGGKLLSGDTIHEAVDASLKRLQTDYIDLYQLHWPNRTSPHFAKHWPGMVTFSEANTQEHIDNMLDILRAIDNCVKAGKIRHFGLSDDTTWGIHQYLKLSEQYDLPRIVSIQNEFSLLHTKDWPYLIEHCIHEDIAYLPWSPLAGGMLSGKYMNDARPEGSRWSIAQRLGLIRDTEAAQAAVKAFVEIAHAYDYTPSQLALAWCDQVDGVSSTIIGATSMAQLQEDIDAFDKPLSEAAISDISSILKRYPSPF